MMTRRSTFHRFSKAPLALAVSTAIFFSYHVQAQQSSEQNTAKKEAGIERITVTASRRPQTVEEIPYNISVISGSQLEEKHIIDSVDMMREISGITVVDRGYRNSGAINNIIIRGMNIDSAGNGDFALNAAPTVSTYVNDTPLFANFILKDIESVEVLRGPQGTLYGSGSLAGTVRYKMNRPDLQDSGGSISGVLSQSKGSKGLNQNYDALLNFALSDSIALRGYLGRIDNDGIVDYSNVYQLNTNGVPLAQNNDLSNGKALYRSEQDADDVAIDYGRIAMLWQPSEQFNALLSYQFQQDDIGARRQVTRGTNWVNDLEQRYNQYENGAVQLEPSEREVEALALEMEWDLGFATATSSTSDYDHSGNSISDNTGFYAQNGWFSSFYGGTPRPMATASRFYQDKGFSQELRLVSNGKQSIDWIVGLFYMNQDTASGQDSLMPGFTAWAEASGFADTLESWGGVVGEQDFYYRDKRNIKDKSFFGELTYHWHDKFRTTVGIRNFSNEITNDTIIDLPLFPGASKVTSNVEDDGTIFKFNLSYDWSSNSMLFATLSEGYRRGGTSAVPVSGSFAENPAYLNYKSDDVLNKEIGFKGNTGRHFYSASVFHTDWDNPQLNIPTPNWGFYAAVNGESARSQGAEFEIRGYLSDAVQYNLSYALVDATLTNDLIAPAGSADKPRTYVYAKNGEQLPSMAEHTFSASISHSYELGSGYYLVNSASSYYQSDSRNALGSNPDFAIDLDSFWLANIGSSLHSDQWTISIFVRNLFNEDGVTGTLSEGYMGTAPTEHFYGNASKDYITQPRTIGLTFNYQF